MRGKGSVRGAGQNGGVIVEASIWLAFLAVLVPILTDLFFVSNTYLSLNQIAREAILTQVSYPQSLVTNFPVYTRDTTDLNPPTMAQQQSELSGCVNGGAYINPTNFRPRCAHRFIKWRIRRLLESHNVRIKPENVRIRTSLGADGVMTVLLETSYDSFSFWFDGKRLSNTVNARYIGNS